MNAFWAYFWPPFCAGLVVAVIAGAMGYPRPRKKRNATFAIGALVSIALAALWHGPLGAADRYVAEVERTVRAATIYWEIPQVSGHVQHGPLTRHVLLSGPADDFQRSQLVQIVGDLPGVESASWSSAGGGLPLIVEGAIAALLGFLCGLVLAYLRELRRRYNANWNW
jgi:membrane protease YdiL (CAAX protease family)